MTEKELVQKLEKEAYTTDEIALAKIWYHIGKEAGLREIAIMRREAWQEGEGKY